MLAVKESGSVVWSPQHRYLGINLVGLLFEMQNMSEVTALSPAHGSSDINVIYFQIIRHLLKLIFAWILLSRYDLM